MGWSDRVGRRLKLRDLRILLTAAQTGSMLRAAQQLGVSQPVVSKAIADLEHMLGVRLFDRSSRGVEPTIYGRALLMSGTSVFDELRQGVKHLEWLKDPSVGELRIAGGEPIVAGILPVIIERLAQRYPRIICHAEITTAFTKGEFPELKDRSADLAIGRIVRSAIGDEFKTETLFYDRIHVVAGRKSKWAHRRKIKLSELMNEEWIITPPHLMPTILAKEAFEAEGLPLPPARIVSTSIHLRNSLLPTGRYLALLPTSFVRSCALRNELKVLPVELVNQPQPVGIITLVKRTAHPILAIFAQCAKDVAKELAINP